MKDNKYANCPHCGNGINLKLKIDYETQSMNDNIRVKAIVHLIDVEKSDVNLP